MAMKQFMFALVAVMLGLILTVCLLPAMKGNKPDQERLMLDHIASVMNRISQTNPENAVLTWRQLAGDSDWEIVLSINKALNLGSLEDAYALSTNVATFRPSSERQVVLIRRISRKQSGGLGRYAIMQSGGAYYAIWISDARGDMRQ
jgi:hypothetical protein